jgi:hypothetical protein
MTFQPQPAMALGAMSAGGGAASAGPASRAGHGRAVHDAAVAVVAAHGVVHGAAIVPDHHHALAPDVAVDEAVLGHVLVEAGQQRGGLVRRHPLDPDRVDGRDEERFSPGYRMGANQRMGAGLVGLGADDDRHRALVQLAGVLALGSVGAAGRMHGPHRRQFGLGGLIQRLIGARGVAVEGVAADRRDDLGAQDGGRGRLWLKAPVGMPGAAERRELLVGLAPHLQHIRMALHRGHIRVLAERSDLQGEGLQRLEAERLVRKTEHRVARPGGLHLGQDVGRQGP